MDRRYEVEAENVLPEGFWPGQALEAQADDPNALAQLMLDAAVVLQMVGGTFSIIAIRKEIAPDLWVPDRYVAKWGSYAPGIRADQPQQQPAAAPAPAPDPEPTPEAEAEVEEEFGTDPETEDAPDPLASDEFGPDAERALQAAGVVSEG